MSSAFSTVFTGVLFFLCVCVCMFLYLAMDHCVWDK